MVIADSLFYCGVSYFYQRAYEHDTADAAHRQYYPDFFYPDAALHHEHFALNAEGEAPAEHLIEPHLLDCRVEVHLVGVGGNGAQMAACLARLDVAMRARPPQAQLPPADHQLDDPEHRLDRVLAQAVQRPAGTRTQPMQHPFLWVVGLRRRDVGGTALHDRQAVPIRPNNLIGVAVVPLVAVRHAWHTEMAARIPHVPPTRDAPA